MAKATWWYRVRRRLIWTRKPIPLWFAASVLVMVLTVIVGPPTILTLTDYESRGSVKFATPFFELTFVIQLKADGPMTTYKDITFLGAQVLAFPQRAMTSYHLSLWGDLYFIEINRTVDWPANVSQNVFIDGSPADGRTWFTIAGPRNVSAALWVYPGGFMGLTRSDEATVVVLPKEADDAWSSGRLQLVAVSVAAALFAVPATAKELRDLYRDDRGPE